MPYSYSGKAGGVKSMGGSSGGSSGGRSGGGFLSTSKTTTGYVSTAGSKSNPGGYVSAGTSGSKSNWGKPQYLGGVAGGTLIANTKSSDITSPPPNSPKAATQAYLKIKRRASRNEKPSPATNKTKLGIGKSNVQPINVGVFGGLNY